MSSYPSVPSVPPLPPQPFRPPNPPTARRRRLSYLWAALPLLTLGFGTPFVFAYAAIRRRSGWHWLAAGGYTALTVTALATSDAADGSVGSTLFGVAIGLLMVGGTVHALAIRSSVVGGSSRSGEDGLDAAIAVAKQRRSARAQARELAAGDPALARDLHVGRPDIPRSFDDGGLIDLNSAPPAVLAQLPGMTPRLVDQIVRAREEAGAFISAEELSAVAELPPALTDTIAEYAVFLT